MGMPMPVLKSWERTIMHELSIVTYVIEQVEEIAKENQLTDIESVTLEFGEVSGIEPEYLVDCWNWYAKKTPLIEHTKFLYETIPAVTWCNACKSTYPTLQYGKTCPHCGSGRIRTRPSSCRSMCYPRSARHRRCR